MNTDDDDDDATNNDESDNNSTKDILNMASNVFSDGDDSQFYATMQADIEGLRGQLDAKLENYLAANQADVVAWNEELHVLQTKPATFNDGDNVDDQGKSVRRRRATDPDPSPWTLGSSEVVSSAPRTSHQDPQPSSPKQQQQQQQPEKRIQPKQQQKQKQQQKKTYPPPAIVIKHFDSYSTDTEPPAWCSGGAMSTLGALLGNSSVSQHPRLNAIRSVDLLEATLSRDVTVAVDNLSWKPATQFLLPQPPTKSKQQMIAPAVASAVAASDAKSYSSRSSSEGWSSEDKVISARREKVEQVAPVVQEQQTSKSQKTTNQRSSKQPPTHYTNTPKEPEEDRSAQPPLMAILHAETPVSSMPPPSAETPMSTAAVVPSPRHSKLMARNHHSSKQLSDRDRDIRREPAKIVNKKEWSRLERERIVYDYQQRQLARQQQKDQEEQQQREVPRIFFPLEGGEDSLLREPTVIGQDAAVDRNQETSETDSDDDVFEIIQIPSTATTLEIVHVSSPTESMEQRMNDREASFSPSSRLQSYLPPTPNVSRLVYEGGRADAPSEHSLRVFAKTDASEELGSRSQVASGGGGPMPVPSSSGKGHYQRAAAVSTPVAAMTRQRVSPEVFDQRHSLASCYGEEKKEDDRASSRQKSNNATLYHEAPQKITDGQSVRLKLIEDPFGDTGQYTGMLIRGKPRGQGTMQYEDGRCYSGAFKGGRWHGQGRALFSNGDLYVGEYEMDQRHGKGRYEWEDGRVYDGMFHRDQRQGIGTYTWVDGAVYNGDFFAGQRHGHGTYKFVDGSVYVGEWKSGKYHGIGECEWASGRCYKGEWENGRAHGYGRETRPDNSVRHDGEWKNDRPVRKKSVPDS